MRPKFFVSVSERASAGGRECSCTRDTTRNSFGSFWCYLENCHALQVEVFLQDFIFIYGNI